jgi:hypothetical protein
MRMAYLAGGRLFVQDGSQDPREIESTFGQELIQRAEQVAQRHEWKTKGSGAAFMSGGMLWGVNSQDQQVRNVRITGMTVKPGGSECYLALESPPVGALLCHNLCSGAETRILHRERFQCTDLVLHSVDPLLACSLRFQNGSANIAIMATDGSDLREVTEGDSVDEAPSWVPGSTSLVYQSSGVGRSPEGFFAGVGPITVMKLDVDSGSLDTLLQDSHYDFLTPRLTSSDVLYYIRRPYEPFVRPSVWRIAGDVVLFPFRLLRALLAYLNFFSLTYTRKPLTAAGGPKFEGRDLRQLIVRGRMIEAAKKLREQTNDERALVPRSWELRRRTTDGNDECLARGVLCFDLASDGSIFYSNGTTVFRVNSQGKPCKLAAAPLIESLVILEG